MFRRKFCQCAMLAGGWFAKAAWSGAAEVATGRAPTVDEARAALRRAVRFFDQEVSVGGGYLWAYSEDLSLREGEGKAGPTTAWAQPPGTPSVGMAILDAYRLTHEEVCLHAAQRTAHALVQGQLVSGGWDYRIEFDPQARRRYRYRTSPAGDEKAADVSTLDDDTTQSALRFLMEYDRETGMGDGPVHEAIRYGLHALVAVQRPNGGWPQRFSKPPQPDDYPDLPASYPESWSREWPRVPYQDCYTLNDNAHADTLKTFLAAWRIYEDDAAAAAACRAGEFLIKARMPDPQPAWAQQYDRRMQPCWARKFEPPAISGGESQGVMRSLIVLFDETGDRRFLSPIPAAIEYLRRSALPDGSLARFYELKTNRPLFFASDYRLTYSDADTPTHYAFKVGNQLSSIERQYEQAIRNGPRPTIGKRAAPPRWSASLAEEARRVIEELDDRGAWLEKGRLTTAPSDAAGERILTCRTFIRNLGVLARYLAATESA
ncbi:pectate lyase [Thermopirellula anaerolimosa]